MNIFQKLKWSWYIGRLTVRCSLYVPVIINYCYIKDIPNNFVLLTGSRSCSLDLLWRKSGWNTMDNWNVSWQFLIIFEVLVKLMTVLYFLLLFTGKYRHKNEIWKRVNTLHVMEIINYFLLIMWKDIKDFYFIVCCQSSDQSN